MVQEKKKKTAKISEYCPDCCKMLQMQNSPIFLILLFLVSLRIPVAFLRLGSGRSSTLTNS